jgi:hypothetical protein
MTRHKRPPIPVLKNKNIAELEAYGLIYESFVDVLKMRVANTFYYFTKNEAGLFDYERHLKFREIRCNKKILKKSIEKVVG